MLTLCLAEYRTRTGLQQLLYVIIATAKTKIAKVSIKLLGLFSSVVVVAHTAKTRHAKQR